jgi:hypothetical protein
MKCTTDELWGSINRIMLCGDVFTAQDCGYTFPEALKQCCVVMIRDGRPEDWYDNNPNQRVLDEQNIIDALKELHHTGWITFP